MCVLVLVCVLVLTSVCVSTSVCVCACMRVCVCEIYSIDERQRQHVLDSTHVYGWCRVPDLKIDLKW